MNLILHIRICKDPFNFIEPITLEGVQYIDIDNFSDATMIATINKAIDLSERLLVFTQIAGQYEIGLLIKVLQKLMKFKGHRIMFHSGSHNKLDKMLKLLNSSEREFESVKVETESYFI